MQIQAYEQTIDAPAADVWAFMVDPAALSVWFGADAWLDPVEGGAVWFRFLDGSIRRGVIVTVEHGRCLSWRWREHRGAGFGSSIGDPSTVTIELQPVNGATRVSIVERPGDARTRAREATA